MGDVKTNSMEQNTNGRQSYISMLERDLKYIDEREQGLPIKFIIN